MEALAKIEELINQGLLWLWRKLAGLLSKLLPPRVRAVFARAGRVPALLLARAKALPAQAKAFVPTAKAWLLANAKFDFKLLLAETLDQGQKLTRELKGASPLKAIAKLVCYPFSLVARVRAHRRLRAPELLQAEPPRGLLQ